MLENYEQIYMDIDNAERINSLVSLKRVIEKYYSKGKKKHKVMASLEWALNEKATEAESSGHEWLPVYDQLADHIVDYMLDNFSAAEWGAFHLETGRSSAEDHLKALGIITNLI